MLMDTNGYRNNWLLMDTEQSEWIQMDKEQLAVNGYRTIGMDTNG